MKTNIKLGSTVVLAMVLVVLFGTAGISQVQGPNHGSSTIVVANHAKTWQNASGILMADGRFASVSLGISQVSDTLEVSNFHFNIPGDAVIEGITVTIKRGASNIGITDNMVKLIRNGTVCGSEHATSDEWPLDPQTVTYGADDDKWGTDLTPAELNSYGFGVALCVSNSVYGIDMNTANIDYVNVTVNYKRPDELGMVDYSAYFDQDEVRLDWTMAAQSECLSFTVQRSADGIKSEAVGNVQGIVNAPKATSYSFTDHSPLFGTSYYRIEAKNADGTVQDFNWVAVSTNERISDIFLFPNPTGDKVTVKFPSNGQPALLMVMDIKGRVTINETQPTFANEDNTTFVQDVSNLPQGMYTVMVNNGDKNYTNRFVKQ